MTDENKKACIHNIKKQLCEFYKAPCFWLKISLLLVIFILACIGIYKIATLALYYFNAPLSFFDPERLGQLGDFLGGTFNPIFGFLTVCLLLWSVFIQRKELSLTRDELKKSADALNNQLKISIHQYNRKQIEEILIKKEAEYSHLMRTGFEKISIDYVNELGTPSTTQLTTIEGMINSQKSQSPPNLNNIVNGIINTKPKGNNERERRKKFLEFIDLTLEINKLYIELLKITSIESIRNHIKYCSHKKIETAILLHLLPVLQLNEIQTQIETTPFNLDIS